MHSLSRTNRSLTLVLVGLALFGLAGCGQSSTKPAEPLAAKAPSPEAAVTEGSQQTSSPADPRLDKAPELPSPATKPPSTPEEVQARLREKNPLMTAEVRAEIVDDRVAGVAIHDENLHDLSPLAGLPLRFLDIAGCPVEDLYPLQGMPLEVLYLERTRVQDLRPLKGMPLVELRLNETPVEDISPLAGAPLRRLYLARTRVRDLSPLAGALYLDSLWLNDTPVEDIRPLASCPNLVSLTLAGTRVADLTPLKGLRLERLHIARTPVEDLRPLAWLRLTRLVFSPGRIKAGLEVVRQMPTIREIGTAFGEEDRGLESNLMPPQIFWQEFDAGRIPPE
ncbi:MAG: hypothetical protein NZ899_07400 [Thermoguttaceae bacterium]|nr:hypothetical protein [Thermoguttaceae bacterium]MDW8079621.1 leucine-rich repeat domain-containing protein [Thermoguttaceae bacterium]